MLEKIIQQMNEGVYIIDADTNEFIYANDRFLEMTGMDSDYKGCKCYEKLLGKNEICQHCIRAREEQDYTRYVRLPQKVGNFTTRGYNISENGKNYHIEYLTDRTEIHEAERALSEGEHTLLIALEHSGMIYWEYDFNTKTCYRGERFVKKIGGPEVATNIPAQIEDYHTVVKSDMPKLRRLYNRILKGETDVWDEMRINYLTGVQWGRIRMTLVQDNADNNTKAVCTIENTQINKEMEEGLAVVSEQNKIHFFAIDLKNSRIKVYKSRRRGKSQEIDYNRELREEFLERVHPLDLQLIQNAMECLRKGHEQDEIVIRLKDKSGSGYDYYSFTFTTTLDDEGKPDKILGTCKEINENIKKERNYKSQLAYMEIYKKSSLAYVEIQVDKNKLNNVKTKYQTLRKGVDGHSIENWVELLCKNTLTEDGKETLRSTFSQDKLRAQFERGYTHFKVSIPFQLRPDYQAWLSITTTLLLNPATSRVEGYVYISDETEKRQSDAITNSVVELSYEVVVVVDMYTGELSNTYKYSNQFINTNMAYNYYQESAEVETRFVLEEDRARIYDEFSLEKIREKILEGKECSSFFSVKGNDGRLYRKKVTCTRLIGFDTKIILTIQDVSDVYFKELEKQHELSLALEKAETAAAAKTDFLSRMSHDIRTPLNGVLGMARIAAEETKESGTKEYLDKIMTAGQMLLSLVNDILDLTKIDERKMELREDEYRMREFTKLIKTVIGEMCNNKSLDFEFVYGELDNLVIKTDKLRFNQIFMNLLSNAIKYTKEGGKVSFHIDKVASNDNYNQMQFVVEDNGQGMSEEFLETAFDAFAQESVVTTARRDGSGLGLAIVKQLVDLMDGSIELISEVGVGTKAIVTIWFEIAEETEEDGEEVLDEKVLVGKRILVAEDQALNAMIATKILQKWGMEVDVAENGQIAVEKFNDSELFTYAAILMDIRMPVMDGMGASKAIRALDRADSKLPIIAMTANAFEEDRRASMEAGMNAHLAKPINPEEVISTLQRMIR